MSTLIKGGRIVDPSQGVDRVADILIDGGRVIAIGPESCTATTTIDATGKIVAPGFIDLHASFREPGFEDDETTATGAASALVGGFTTVCSLPETSPVVDNRGAAEFILLQAARAGLSRVLPIGAITKNREGAELAEIGQLVEGGAVAFSDGHRPIANAEIMRRALEYTQMFKRPLFNFPQVPELVDRGVMHEGLMSTLLGLRGMPAEAQDIMVGRDIALAELTDGRIHLVCVTTADSVAQVRRARERGVKVTCDVTPHHLVLTDESLRNFDSNCKVNPPLRTSTHIAELVAGLNDDTIDAISADHQPLAFEKKQVELDQAPFGIVGLETLLPLCVTHLVRPGHITWSKLVEKLTVGPAQVLGIDRGTLSVGSSADVTIIDPDVEWTIDRNKFHSKSNNTPFGGKQVRGRVESVLIDGRVLYASGELFPHKTLTLQGS